MLKIGTSRKGRKCKHHGCKHVLSIYNHEAYCHVHGDSGEHKKDKSSVTKSTTK